SDVACVWAPEVTYDDKLGKLMIYFTMRFGTKANKLYYVYVNDDFDTIETLPRLLYEYPDPKISAIDADISKIGDKYHMFYVAHDGVAGIKQTVSNSFAEVYVYETQLWDPEDKACEAPNLWKRIGEEKWVLMYDCYGIQPHNFGFSETTDFVNFTNLGRFNEGVMKTTNFSSPKHGAVIHLKKKEAEDLAKHWGSDLEF
ncbi:MAG: beta-xylosidase, partial [Bacteroidales bacterium]|nr:beta-xylosidase [Bacteroidales bacterium]